MKIYVTSNIQINQITFSLRDVEVTFASRLWNEHKTWYIHPIFDFMFACNLNFECREHCPPLFTTLAFTT